MSPLFDRKHVSAGVVKTDIFEAGGFGASGPFGGKIAAIQSEDISNAVLYLLSTPYSYLTIEKNMNCNAMASDYDKILANYWKFVYKKFYYDKIKVRYQSNDYEW